MFALPSSNALRRAAPDAAPRAAPPVKRLRVAAHPADHAMAAAALLSLAAIDRVRAPQHPCPMSSVHSTTSPPSAPSISSALSTASSSSTAVTSTASMATSVDSHPVRAKPFPESDHHSPAREQASVSEPRRRIRRVHELLSPEPDCGTRALVWAGRASTTTNAPERATMVAAAVSIGSDRSTDRPTTPPRLCVAAATAVITAPVAPAATAEEKDKEKEEEEVAESVSQCESADPVIDLDLLTYYPVEQSCFDPDTGYAT